MFESELPEIQTDQSKESENKVYIISMEPGNY